MNRIRAQYCTVPNPYNPKQVIYVSLDPQDVDAIVFWSKDPQPMLSNIHDLQVAGYKFYFQFTVNGYPAVFEPEVRPLEDIIVTFSRLADMLSPDLVIWRYDPIIWSNLTGRDYHLRRFETIAKSLKGRTRRVMISLLDDYRGSGRRLSQLSSQGIEVWPVVGSEPEVHHLLRDLAGIASQHEMEILACAEAEDLSSIGIRPGKCVDDDLILTSFHKIVSPRKDPGQRMACRCVESRDIGIYDTCQHGCVYCYATSRSRYVEHSDDSPSLTGFHDSPRPCSSQGTLGLRMDKHELGK